MDLSMLGKIFGIGSGLGQAGMGAYNAFGGGYSDPTKNASNTIGQIPGQTSQYYTPYMDAGKGALNTLQNQYGDLLGGTVQNKLGEGYKESPGYQFKLEQALRGGSNAAAAGGMLGTPLHQQQAMQLGNDIASQDYNDYIKNQMGLYGLGLSGEQGINQMGYNASDAQANTLANALGQQGQLQFYGDQSKNMWKKGGQENILSSLASLAGFF